MARPERATPHASLSCPSCGSDRLTVVDSRPFEGMVRRRRRCSDCEHRMTTYEVTSYQKRLIDEWARTTDAIRALCDQTVARLNQFDREAHRRARDQVLRRDMAPNDVLPAAPDEARGHE